VADNFTSGSDTFRADDVGGIKYQYTKGDVGGDGVAIPLIATSSNLAGMPVSPRLDRARLTATSTISSGSIYAAKDAVGGIWTFASAARFSGGTGVLRAVTIYDLGQQLAALDLVLFSATIAGTVTDNAAFDPTDADLDNVQYVTSIAATTGWKDFNDNAVAQVACEVPYVCAATSLFGALVARGTPTYTSTGDLKIALMVERD
jgi:hypothetical protein